MRLRRSAIAEQDLVSIWEYIAQDNPTAADGMLQRFDKCFQSLLAFPFVGESQDRFRAGLRSIVEGAYINFYEPRPDEIVIYRVLHGARKWEDLLADEAGT